MKVLFYTNIPSPYRVAFFNELGKHCELTVLFETATSKERDDIWKEFEFENFKGIILKGIRTRVDSAFCPGIIKYLEKNAYDHIVITQLASLTAIWAVAYMRMKGIKYCYEGDGGFVGSITGLKATLKRFVIKNAQICFSTSKEFDKYCIAYGAKEENIYRYPFSSITDEHVLMKPLNKEEKSIYKRQIRIEEEFIILSVGQFIYRKGFDVLLEASKSLDNRIGVYIVGGKPTAEYLELKRKWNLQNVHFLDFMSKDKLEKYYRTADIFVLPTREDIWGLVVNEALAKGLPVITTNKCIAGLELVEDGKNGYIVKSEDIDDFVEKISKFIESDVLLERCAEGALNTAKQYTIEKMAERHMEVFRL